VSCLVQSLAASQNISNAQVGRIKEPCDLSTYLTATCGFLYVTWPLTVDWHNDNEKEFRIELLVVSRVCKPVPYERNKMETF
jgi:hypothetical protein